MRWNRTNISCTRRQVSYHIRWPLTILKHTLDVRGLFIALVGLLHSETQVLTNLLEVYYQWWICFNMQTHCGQDSNLHVVLNSTGPDNGPMSTIPSPRVPGVNYSPAWMLPADSIYHIETHYATLWTWTLSNVFLYGRGTGTRTLIDRLKAGYSSLWIIPPYGPSTEIRTQTSRIKSPVCQPVTSWRDGS